MFSIGVVARQTGIEIGTLRKWETRYGFPQPQRSPSGQRYYLEADIDRLLLIVRRIENGERVGKIIRESTSSLAEPAHTCLDAEEPAQPCDATRDALAALLACDLQKLKRTLDVALSQRTILAFVEEVAAPLTQMVGEYWVLGRLPIHGEHLFSSVIDSVLSRAADRSKGDEMQPQVLLTSPAGELHTLGLSMVNAVLSESGIASVRLPGGLPLPEIVAACAAWRVKVVGISASSHYPPKMLRAMVRELRSALPPDVTLWFGGAGMKKVTDIPPGVAVIYAMSQLRDACNALNTVRNAELDPRDGDAALDHRAAGVI